MANCFLRFPGGKCKALTFSYDDGPREDEKLIELFNKYGVKGTFNINSGAFPAEGSMPTDDPSVKSFRLTKNEAYNLYSKSGQEVACHTLTHADLPSLPISKASYEVMGDRERLEEMFGTLIDGMSYPHGTYNDEIVDLLKNAGILYARTSDSSHSFDIPKDFLRFNPTCHHADEDVYELIEKFKATNLNGRDRDPILFYIWGHSFEFSPRFGGDFNGIEKLVKTVAGMEDTWYATNGEIFRYITAFRQLRFSMNERFVYNPTYTEICIFHNEKNFTIKPGETVELK